MELRFAFESSEHMRQLERWGALEVFPQSVGQMDAILAADVKPVAPENRTSRGDRCEAHVWSSTGRVDSDRLWVRVCTAVGDRYPELRPDRSRRVAVQPFPAWAWAGNTPFAWGKQVASHLGGTRNPLVVRCPQRITDNGGLRSQFTHVTDIGPMILDMVGIPQPTHVDGVEQQPMTGVSFADSLENSTAPERHTQQYFENFGNRAMYKDGWWLSMRMPRVPWRLDPELLKKFAPGVWKPDEDPVELYFLPDDFSQANDLSASHPEKVKELQTLFWEEAEKYNIKPLLAGFSPFFGILPPLGSNTTVTYHGDVQNVAPGAVPRVYNHSYTISADLHIPDGGAEGVIVADASHLGGFSLFVQDGKLKHTYAFLGVFEYHQESEGKLPTGDVNVELTFAADEAKPATPGEITLFVNGERVGSGRIDHTVPFGFSGYAGLDVGRDNGLVVDRSYADKAPFAFTGTVKKVVFDVAPHLDDADEHALHEHASQADTVRGIRA